MFENNNNNSGNTNYNYGGNSYNNNYSNAGSNNNPYVNPGSGYDNTYYQVKKAPKKGKGKVIALISGTTAAAMVGGGVIAYNYSPFVKNQVKLRTMDSEDYYSWVNKENAKSLSEMYGDTVSTYEDGHRTNLTLSYELSDDVKDIFANEFLASDAKNMSRSDLEMLEQVKKAVYDTDSLSVSLDSVTKEGNAMFSMAGLRNEEKLLSFDFLLNNEESDLFMRIPELSEEWIGFSFDEYLDELRGENEYLDKLLDVRVEFMKSPSSFLSQEELEEELVRYVGIWSDTVDDVKVVKSKNVKIGSIESEYTVASVKVDKELAMELAKNYLEAFREDEIIKGLLIDKLSLIDEDQYLDTIDELLIDLEEEKDGGKKSSGRNSGKSINKNDNEDDEDYEDEDEDDSEAYFTVSTFIDPNGVIRGIDLASGNDGLRAIIGKEDDQVCGEVWFKEDGRKTFSIDLDAEVDGDEYTGSIKFDADDETAEIKFRDFRIVNEEHHYFDADVTICLPGIDPIDLRFDADDDSQTVSYDIFIDDTDYGTVVLKWSTEDGVDLDMPDESNSTFVTEDTIEEDLKSYLNSDMIYNFAYDTLVKLGIENDTAEELAGQLADEFDEEFD